MKKIVLASSSPRRSELLQKLGVPFVVDASDFDESSVCVGNPVQYVKTTALGKAKKVAERHPHSLVIGADTIVVCDSDIFGKPRDAKHARDILGRLQGRAHSVLTGLALYDADTHRFSLDAEETRLHFQPLSQPEIAAFVKSGEGLGAAGGYDIRGMASLFLEKIEGEYANVLGLPLETLRWRLAALGVPVRRNSAG